MRWVRLAALLLGSVYFFPVSCTTSIIAGTHIIASLDARDSSKGEVPHEQACVIAVLPNASMEAFLFSKVDAYKSRNPQASFLLPKNSGEFSVGSYKKASFVVTEQNPGSQIIEALCGDDDLGALFRYEASRNEIKPIFSKLWYHGYMFGAIPYALALAFALYLIGLFMRRKLKVAPKA